MFSFAHILGATSLALLAFQAEAQHSDCYYWAHPQDTMFGAELASKTEGVTAHLMPDHIEKRLRRRLDPTKPTTYIPTAPGAGACNVTYDTDNQDIGCLWTGETATQPGPNPGWMGGWPKLNCNKKLWVKNNGKTIYVTVLDGCKILSDPVEKTAGCAEIYLSKKAFSALGGDVTSGSMKIRNWDFDQSTPGQ
ncbi:hypothetical protein O181_047610 [Austropuccinia psidii MF-1]|uniref:Secreted protein n=1 Tax=Austropuccinia psidii MF-1 TaxID=1389203 RepID=A0A9Q3HNC5_9BASI|nr:hypothetical protein [Austropuccinia psidii MF-1]